MTLLCDATHDPAGWTSADIGGKDGLTRRMTAAQLAALDELVAATQHIAPDEITRADFDHPVINAMMDAARETIMAGHGAVILAGADVAALGIENFKRVYWGLGTHLGQGAVQSYRRDRIGHVRKEKDNPTGRGYLMDSELISHTDFHEILSLASVSKPLSGGESGIVSSIAIHNIIRQERPDLIAPLYAGYYHESAGGTVSESKVPVFGCVDGRVSCYFHMPFVFNAAKRLGQPLPADFLEAMRFMSKVATRPEVRADFTLEPGEMLFWHNFTALHSREAFVDSPEHTRLLLRLWINVPDGRPLPAAFHERAAYMDRVHEAGEAAIDYVVERA